MTGAGSQSYHESPQFRGSCFSDSFVLGFDGAGVAPQAQSKFVRNYTGEPGDLASCDASE